MNTRTHTLIIAIAALLMSLACGATTPVGKWDGTWEGITSQEERIELVVRGDTVTVTKFGAVVRGDDWEVPTEQNLSVKAPISDDGSFHVYSESGTWIVEMKGTFHEDLVEGIVVLTYLPEMYWEWLMFTARQV